jgi:DNA repair protein RadA/Sms
MAYRCSACGYMSPKWMGFCPQCGSDGALEQTGEDRRKKAKHPAAVVSVTDTGGDSVVRRRVAMNEVDRVLGGGLVPGAAVLLGGEPGVGKSTLLLQMAGAIAGGGGSTLIASAEESLEQVGLRAGRLGIDDPNVFLAAERDVDAIITAAGEMEPKMLAVDSIQAVAAGEVEGAPGGVSQVRECAARLVHFAKESGVPVIIVGHVTKDGGIAGPKLLEHTVDVVLYLEGEAERGLRLLRSLKNRFGATHQVGVFEMRDVGMAEVPDPSGLLLARWDGGVPGSVVFPAVDGRRPLLVEVQALVTDSSLPQPQRSVRGLEAARVHQVIAVLEKHTGVLFRGKDVYVNVVGGIRLQDPGGDLPVAIALVSSLLDKGLGPTAAWGEIGLTGEVRPVAHAKRRAEEAARLGIGTIIDPADGLRIDKALAGAGLP